MFMKVKKNEVIRLLEIIMETQSDEQDSWGNDSAVQKASDMLLTMMRIPVECDNIFLTEEESLFLAEYT